MSSPGETRDRAVAPMRRCSTGVGCKDPTSAGGAPKVGVSSTSCRSKNGAILRAASCSVAMSASTTASRVQA